MKDGWIGVTDQWGEGRWQTPLKASIPYSSWSRGEPNNAGNEDCTMQHGNKLWNDLNCNSKQPYICQFKAGKAHSNFHLEFFGLEFLWSVYSFCLPPSVISLI